MLQLTRFQPDTDRTGEFLAHLWQGPVPASLILLQWLYVDTSPRSILLLWDGDEEAEAYVARAIGGFGTVTTQRVTDATDGLALCLARDLDGFGRWLAGRGATDEEIVRQLDVRRRGLEAATPEAARAAGQAWTAGGEA